MNYIFVHLLDNTKNNVCRKVHATFKMVTLFKEDVVAQRRGSGTVLRRNWRNGGQ